MKIEVVIPVVNYGLAMDLLDQMSENTISPDRVIIINNTKEGHNWDSDSRNFISEFYYSTTGMANESLELGRSKLSRDCDLVTFLNDDLIIGSWFFERIIQTFEADKKHGIVVPATMRFPDQVVKGKFNHVVMKRGIEAWAMTIKRSVLDKIPAFPWDRLSTFYWDNWIWAYARNMKYTCGKDEGNTIYHYIGTSILKFGYKDLKGPERAEWRKVKEEFFG